MWLSTDMSQVGVALLFPFLPIFINIFDTYHFTVQKKQSLISSLDIAVEEQGDFHLPLFLSLDGAMEACFHGK